MARIAPFRGLYYNPEKIQNLSKVITPPCERIDDAAQARYYAEHPANVVRLEAGLSFPRDSEVNNRYTRAARYLEKWLKDDILCFDSRPGFYAYQQQFELNGQFNMRMGLNVLMEAETSERIMLLPSEMNTPRAAADRLNLLLACRTDFSPVLALYDDKESRINKQLHQWIDKKLPLIEMSDETGMIHKVWTVDAPEVIDALRAFIETESLYIAEGQHRYAGILQYQQDLHNHEYEGRNYMMTLLMNYQDADHLIVPVNRMAGGMTHGSKSILRSQCSKITPQALTFNSGVRAGLLMHKRS